MGERKERGGARTRPSTPTQLLTMSSRTKTAQRESQKTDDLSISVIGELCTFILANRKVIGADRHPSRQSDVMPDAVGHAIGVSGIRALNMQGPSLHQWINDGRSPIRLKIENRVPSQAGWVRDII